MKKFHRFYVTLNNCVTDLHHIWHTVIYCDKIYSWKGQILLFRWGVEEMKKGSKTAQLSGGTEKSRSRVADLCEALRWFAVSCSPQTDLQLITRYECIPTKVNITAWQFFHEIEFMLKSAWKAFFIVFVLIWLAISLLTLSYSRGTCVWDRVSTLDSLDITLYLSRVLSVKLV